MKLFRSDTLPDQWVGEDKHGRLMVWPAKPRGWLQRTAYDGPKRGTLIEVDPAEARGTGWPGGPTGRKPRSSGPTLATPVTIRVTAEERESWERAAKDYGRRLSDWCRGELNAVAARPRGKGK